MRSAHSCSDSGPRVRNASVRLAAQGARAAPNELSPPREIGPVIPGSRADRSALMYDNARRPSDLESWPYRMRNGTDFETARAVLRLA